jgi:uncharacterized membrane protein
MREKTFHRLFTLGVVIKGVDGVLEIAGGWLMLFVRGDRLTAIVHYLTEGELSEDPEDLVANFLRNLVENLTLSTELFAAVYLLAHGLIKIWLVSGLLRRRLWAYPSALCVLNAFIAYQVYRLTLTHSPALLALTVFDLVIVFLIWHEYRVLRREPRRSPLAR